MNSYQSLFLLAVISLTCGTISQLQAVIIVEEVEIAQAPVACKQCGRTDAHSHGYHDHLRTREAF